MDHLDFLEREAEQVHNYLVCAHNILEKIHEQLNEVCYTPERNVLAWVGELLFEPGLREVKRAIEVRKTLEEVFGKITPEEVEILINHGREEKRKTVILDPDVARQVLDIEKQFEKIKKSKSPLQPPPDDPEPGPVPVEATGTFDGEQRDRR